MEGAAAIGASGGPISRNAGNCVQCSSCPYGCAIDAKRGMHVSYLPRAVAAGARIRAGVEARRVLVEDGRAVGVRCVAGAGRGNGRRRPYTVRARRATIVAGGALGTPELLLRSGLGGAPGRPQPPHPPRLLGRRPLRGGGARLGGRDAELLRRRVGDASASCSRRPSPRSPSAAPGCSAPAASTRRRCSASATSARSASTSPTTRAGRVGLAGDGSLRADLQAHRRRRRPPRLRHRPRRRNPLRRRRDRGLPQHRPRCRRAAPGRARRVRGDRASSPPSCGSRPSTRWARRGSPADPATGVCAARRLGQRRRRASTSPTPRSSPPRSASTR